MTSSLLEFQSATELSARLRARELSAVEVLDACARRHEQLNPRVNAIVTPLFAAARKQAHEADQWLARGEDVGPLHGLPVALKDMTETAGVRTTYGSRRFESNVPNHDALLVHRLKAAGAILVPTPIHAGPGRVSRAVCA